LWVGSGSTRFEPVALSYGRRQVSHKDEWTLRALCRGNHSYLFFPPSTFERKDDRQRRELKAKAICGVCPVKGPCSDHALNIKEPFGIWGGMTEGERKSVLAAS
jgi:WhiB family transcriptional regulator, redox-sensing transcriptional regulator